MEAQKNKTVILATTTSVQDTGLLDVLAELFNKKGEYTLKPIAVGSGQAMQLGRQGEADILLVHSPEDEIPFVREGFGAMRTTFMHNEFVLTGPPSDPANVKGVQSIKEAFKKVCSGKSLFVSRGDNSGTHKKELSLWKNADCTPAKGNYLEAGQGMAQTLRIADEKLGYCLADRATYLTLQKTLQLIIVSEGDPLLKNFYSLIPVNPKVSSKINVPGAKAFYDFMLSREVREIIDTFKKDKFGQQLFFTEKGVYELH
ncbi:MAG: substrate-binding domain-containing protein [Candidatus Latescibacter sp.]|nr:substrate-binding domain-containing protein [Candidatus Latescibacter sp.]